MGRHELWFLAIRYKQQADVRTCLHATVSIRYKQQAGQSPNSTTAPLLRMWVDTRDSHATLMPTRHRRRSTTFLASPSRHRSRLDAAHVAGGLCYMQFQPRRVPFGLFHRAAHRSFHQLRRGEWLRQRKAACGFLSGVVAAPLLGCLSERGIFCRRDAFRSCGRGLHAWAALRELRRDESLCRA